jgi:excinuclease ABC subunit C
MSPSGDTKPLDFNLEQALKNLPNQPGVYRMHDKAGAIIYIGKAKVLKNRVRSYFQINKAGMTARIRRMVKRVVWFDTIVTDTEVEALILESNMIKAYKPHYNILLRDDKRFPWIGFSDEAFPRLFITRQPQKSGRSKFFGPYTNSNDLYTTLKLVRRYFPLRQRRRPLFKDRPCMNYYIGNCLAPCQKKVTPEAYQKLLTQVELLLKGKTDELLDSLRWEMEAASESLNFEHAAKLRDCLKAVQSITASKQKVFSDDPTLNQDILAAAYDDKRCIVSVLSVRKGKLLERRSHELPLTEDSTVEEAYAAFIPQYYEMMSGPDLPEELVLQFALPDTDVLEAWLSQLHGKRVSLIVPQRGMKKEMLALGQKNAKEALDQATLYDLTKHQNDPTRALLELQEALDLPDFPARMECYDISHVQGTNTVASMVVFTDGKPDKAAYRRFKIRTTKEGTPDDFASMHEVITRRFKHSSGSKDTGSKDDSWEDPDVVIIDGGKGQLNAALRALGDNGIVDQPIISLAKKFEEVFLPGQERPVILPRDSRALFLLQQIRDESHRFAITYHRSLRAKAATASELDHVHGLGPKRKQALLTHFGSVDKIKQASLAEVGQALGISTKQADILMRQL